MLRSFLCDLCRPLDAGAALSNVGNADRQMAANGDFAKKRFTALISETLALEKVQR